MPLPTLLARGNLRLDDGSYSDEIPIDFIKRKIKNSMYQYLDKTQASIDNRCLIIKSMTGSGKSTTMPVELFRIFCPPSTIGEVEYRGKSILCVEPKVITTIRIATDICDQSWSKDMILGKNVGYITGSADTITPATGSGLIYTTLGVLSMQLNNATDEEFMNKYSIIIVDEAHERTVELDIALLVLKNFYERNRGNKSLPFLILTSATLDFDIYFKYLNVGPKNSITVTGSAYNRFEHWPEKSCKNYLDESFNIVMRIIKEDLEKPKDEQDEIGKGDILIFIMGNSEYKYLIEKLTPILDEYSLMVVNINSLSIQDNTDDFKYLSAEHDTLPQIGGTKNVYKRIIISTSVSETGLTIPSIKYCIDCGWYKTIEYYQPRACGLIAKPITQSRCIQRIGRIGRLFDGHFYPTYTKETFLNMQKQQMPEIFICDFNIYYMSIIREQFKNFAKKSLEAQTYITYDGIDLLDFPSASSFVCANSLAMRLGLLKIYNKQIVPTCEGFFAFKIANKTITMEVIKSLIYAYKNEISINDVLLMSLLIINDREISLSSIFIKRGDSQPKIQKFAKENSLDPDNDILIMYTILKKFYLAFSDNYECIYGDEFKEYDFKVLMGYLYQYKESIIWLCSLGLSPFLFSKNNSFENISKCIEVGFANSIFYKRENAFINPVNNLKINIKASPKNTRFIVYTPIIKQDSSELNKSIQYKLIANNRFPLEGINLINSPTDNVQKRSLIEHSLAEHSPVEPANGIMVVDGDDDSD